MIRAPVFTHCTQLDELLGHWSAEQWAAVPVATLPITDLVPTQECLWLEHIARVAGAETDRPVRVVYHHGAYLLWDGHHRYTIAALRGLGYIPAHVVDHNGQPVAPDQL